MSGTYLQRIVTLEEPYNQSMHLYLQSAPSFSRTILQGIVIIATSAATEQQTVEKKLVTYAKALICD
jgi:hypothetical protein